MLTSDLGKLLALEGCLSGNVAGRRGVHRRAGARAVRASSPSRSRPRRCSGRATFLNQSAIQAEQAAQEQIAGGAAQARAAAAAAALERAARQGLDEAEQQAAGAGRRPARCSTTSSSSCSSSRSEYGQTGLPRLDDPTFVSSVVFDPRRAGRAEAALLDLLSRAPTRR